MIKKILPALLVTFLLFVCFRSASGQLAVLTDHAGKGPVSLNEAYGTELLPMVSITEAGPDPVGQYEKYELQIEILDAVYDNPYDPEQIDLYAWFYKPSGDSVRINGFFDDYQARQSWKIRFSPGETGDWSFRVHARDINGTSMAARGEFSSVSSEHHGWIRISPDNSNYLMHADSTQFYGLAIYYPWNVSESGLDELVEAGVNIFGYWDCSFDGAGNAGGRYLMESMESGVGRYDQRKAARIDELLEWAEQRDLKMMLAIWAHPFLRISGQPWSDGWWLEKNPYSQIIEAGEFFTDSLALAYQEKHHRYLIARYGYSRALGIWELINEAQGTTGWVLSQADTKTWVRQMNSYFKENDPNKRPTTASFRAYNGASHFYPGDGLADIVNVHYYERYGWSETYPGDLVRSGLANVVYEAHKLKDTGYRPAFFGEAGYDLMLSDVKSEAYDWELHNSYWAGLTSGLASTPFWWEFNTKEFITPGRMTHFAALGNFVSTLDLAHGSWDEGRILAFNSDAYVREQQQAAFGWIKTYSDTVLSNSLVYLWDTHLEGGSYSLTWFDTWNGQDLAYDTVAVVAGSIWSRTPEDPRNLDLAFRIEKLPNGEPFSRVSLELVELIDTTTFSSHQKIACMVTDASGLVDASFNGLVNIEMQGDGQPGEFEVGLTQGAALIDYQPGGIPGVTVVASLEGAQGDTLLINGGQPGSTTGVPDRDALPFSLLGSFPNPASGMSHISYRIPEAGHVHLALYDLQGRLVKTLCDEFRQVGTHMETVNTRELQAGVFIYRLDYQGAARSGRLVVVLPRNGI